MIGENKEKQQTMDKTVNHETMDERKTNHINLRNAWTRSETNSYQKEYKQKHSEVKRHFWGPCHTSRNSEDEKIKLYSIVSLGYYQENDLLMKKTIKNTNENVLSSGQE